MRYNARMNKLPSVLAAAAAAFVLAACAVPEPQPRTVTTHYHRTNAPLVLRTPRGNVTFHLLASEAGSALDGVGGDHSRPFTIGLVDPAGFTFASQDGPVRPPFRYTIGESSAWTSLDLTPDGRGLLLYASDLSATKQGSGAVNVSVANEKLAPDALSGLREGDVVTLAVGEEASSAAPAAPQPAATAPAAPWWQQK